MENNFEQYQEPRVLVAQAGQLERAAFYRKTYQHVALSVLAFILVESMFLKIPALVEFMLSMTQGYLWLLLLGAFWLATSMADKLAHDVSQTKQYIGLGIYVVFYALIFIPLLYIAIHFVEGGTALINQAAVITLSLFTGLTAVVFMTKTDFSFLKSAITIGVFIAMGLIVAGIIFGFDLGLWFSFGMVALAGAAILYQTSKLKYEYEVNQYVGASLGLFASLMLMFWYVLQILMSRD
jgi:FtsH-binding integral membrane protein